MVSSIGLAIIIHRNIAIVKFSHFIETAVSPSAELLPSPSSAQQQQQQQQRETIMEAAEAGSLYNSAVASQQSTSHISPDLSIIPNGRAEAAIRSQQEPTGIGAVQK